MVRLASLQDLTDIFLLERDCFRIPMRKDKIERYIRNNQVLVYDWNGIILGYIICSRQSEIIRIAVSRFYRQRNIGRSLVENFNGQSVTVSEKDDLALRFFFGIGFKLAKRLDGWFFNSDGYICVRSRNCSGITQ